MMTNFRGSSYSIETDKDVSFSQANEENVRIAMVGVSEVGKTSIVNCIEVNYYSSRKNDSVSKLKARMVFKSILRESKCINSLS